MRVEFLTSELSPGLPPTLEIGCCYDDCNCDGQVSIADFICFQNRWLLGDPYADCNGSGTHTISDFICFQSCFGQCR